MASQSTSKSTGQSTGKKKSKKVPLGKVYIQSGFSNTLITVTDPHGGAVCWSSAGKLGFKGSRKGTAYAAQMATEDAVKLAIERHGLQSVDIVLKGPGMGREPAVRSIANLGLKVMSIKDVTPVPHNGCRPPKRRRV